MDADQNRIIDVLRNCVDAVVGAHRLRRGVEAVDEVETVLRQERQNRIEALLRMTMRIE